MATKIVGSAGRFGARYGRKLRTRVLEVERRQRKKQLCPYCRRVNARRVSVGVYSCRTCKSKFTGGAYTV